MVRPSPSLPARVALRIGERLVPAIPLSLNGHEAVVLLSHDLVGSQPLRLLLAWHDGSSTELAASVRELGLGGRPTRLDLHAVSGDWKPFLAWLGTQTTP